MMRSTYSYRHYLHACKREICLSLLTEARMRFRVSHEVDFVKGQFRDAQQARGVSLSDSFGMHSRHVGFR
jgi:hypothetical protein